MLAEAVAAPALTGTLAETVNAPRLEGMIDAVTVQLEPGAIVWLEQVS